MCTHCHYPRHDQVRPPVLSDSLDNSGLTQRTMTTDQALDILAAASTDTETRPSNTKAPIPRTSKIEGLDIDKFAPMTTDEAMKAFSKPGMRTAYWDPTNVIPPADLPRIRVIDQTMVGLGLISQEELAQIHEVGKEFEKYRTDFRAIHQAGQVAVQASREERNRIRQQKKAEAAERKRAYDAAVAHRKATDIFFLGRDVSYGLSDRRANIEKLQASELPLLATPADLAKALSLDIPTLRWLAFHSVAAKRVHYVHFTVAKKSGGNRTLSAPHQKLTAAQDWILDNILNRLPTHTAVHGFVKGRSIVTNAQPHVGTDEVINCDLKDFFPTITVHRVIGLFKSFGFSPAASTILALLCTECPRETVKYNGTTFHVATGECGLPQGACTSPAISNLIATHMDLRLAGMAAKLNWNYTRYADDITFSRSHGEAESKDEAHKMVGYVLARIRHIADDEGFQINHKKTRVLRRHTQQSVTGIVVNDRLNVSRKTIRKLRALLHNAKKTGLESQNREAKENFGAWLNGMISYVEMVNAEQGAKLRKSFNEIRE